MHITPCANGTCPVEPFEVRQASLTLGGSEFLLHNLPENYGYWQNSTGYLDAQSGIELGKFILRSLSRNRIKPSFFYFDGHDSHKTKELVRDMFKQDCWIFYLSSGCSIIDQPNDNGF